MGAVGTPQCGFFLSMFSSHVTDSAYELSAFQCSPFLSNPVHFSPLLSVFSVPLCSYPFLLSPLHTSSLLSTPLHSGPFCPLLCIRSHDELPEPPISDSAMDRVTDRTLDRGHISAAHITAHAGRQLCPERPLGRRRRQQLPKDADRLLARQSNR